MSVAASLSGQGTEISLKKRKLDIHGRVDVSFVHKDGETALERLYYGDPLKVLFPRGELPTAALVTTGGGLFGGDRYDIQITLGEKAKSIVTAQAAEKVYRSLGDDCVIDVQLNVADGAVLEWLPQETILFDQARFRRKTTLNIAETGTALAGEMIVFGRLASGEEVKTGLLREAWEIKRAGKTDWIDALHLEGDLLGPLDHPSAFAGARAMATAVFVGEDVNEKLEMARDALSEFDNVKIGATAVNDVLICRWLSSDPYELRKAFGAFWAQFRHMALGRSNSLPRLWNC